MKVFTYKDNANNRRLNRVGQVYTRAQVGGTSFNAGGRPVPDNIKNMIHKILPELSESTQNVIHFLNLRVKNANGKGSLSTAYEALGNRWMQYALFTQDPMNKAMAQKIAGWYTTRAKELD